MKNKAPFQQLYCQREGCGQPILPGKREGAGRYRLRRFCSSRCASYVQHQKNGKASITPQELRKLALQGMNDHAIAAKLHVTSDTVWKWRKKNGIPAAVRRARKPLGSDRNATGMRGAAFKNVFHKIGEALWRSRRFMALDTPIETIEEYFARGGTVTKCPPANVNPYPLRSHGRGPMFSSTGGKCR